MTRKEKRPPKALSNNKKRLWIVLTAATLALALLVGGLLYLYLPRDAVVFSYGSTRVRENAYNYWVACYKYQFLADYKESGAEDTPAWWAADSGDGRTNAEVFAELIDNEIKLRLIASAMYDKYEQLSADAYDTISAALADMETYAYGADAYAELAEEYGVDKRTMKKIAVFEQKYLAFYTYLFGESGEGVYATNFADDLEEFYQTYYYRYNIIYISDENSGNTASVDLAMSQGMTEERFSEFEVSVSEYAVSENYPGGIYLYAYESYSRVFEENLFSAMRSLKNVGEVVKVRDKEDKGTFYVMRYALDKQAYLKDENKSAFASFGAYAAASLYTQMLTEELSNVESNGEIIRLPIQEVKTCKNHNLISLLKSAGK